MTYKEMFFFQYANKNGNIKKNVRAIDVWNTIEEFLRLVLPKDEPKPEKKKKQADLSVLTMGGGGGAK